MTEGTIQDSAQGVVATTLGLLVAVLGRAAFWAPVVFAMAFFAQVSLKGLKPAMAEERRLASEEQRMLGVHEALELEQDDLQLKLEAFADPIYLERERRALLMREAQGPVVLSPTPYSNKPVEQSVGQPVGFGQGDPGQTANAGGGSSRAGSGAGTGSRTNGGPTVR